MWLRTFIALSGLMVVAAIAAVWLVTCTVRPGNAHDAPAGWAYPYSCCSGVDCREFADQAIGEGGNGYTIKATGEQLVFGDSRLKDSPDGHFHWCSVAGADDSRTICLFVPPRGF